MEEPDHAWAPPDVWGGAYIGSTVLALVGTSLGRTDLEPAGAELVKGSCGRCAGVMTGTSLLVLPSALCVSLSLTLLLAFSFFSQLSLRCIRIPWVPVKIAVSWDSSPVIPIQ